VPASGMQPLADWPLIERSRIRGVFTDIDDTLTTHGAITADAQQALVDLKAAGYALVAITGRPIGWCRGLLDGTHGAPWPVDVVVAENGGVACLPDGATLYFQDATTRSAAQLRMREVADKVQHELPQVQVARDTGVRETDLAFDYAEFTSLPQDTVARLIALLQAEGLHTTVSSIHIHACAAPTDKWSGACWIVRKLWGRTLQEDLDAWVCIGDSGNDQAMFAHFRHSVGVANLQPLANTLTHLPRYLTPSPRGAGFGELAAQLLRTGRDRLEGLRAELR